MTEKLFAGWVMASEFAAKLSLDEHRYLRLADTIRALAAQGWDGVEHAPFIDGKAVDLIDDSYISDAKAAMVATGCRVSGLHWILSFLDLVEPAKKDLSIFADDEKKQETLEYYAHLIDYCHALGGTYMVHGSPGSRRKPEGMNLDDAMEKANEFFHTDIGLDHSQTNLLDYAAAYGIRIGFESLGKDETNFINTVAENEAFARMVNHQAFGITLDVKAIYAQNDGEVADVIRNVRDPNRIVAVHFNAPTREAPGLDEAKYSFKPVMHALADRGYTGMITVEPFIRGVKGVSYLEEARRCLSFLRKEEQEVLAERRAA